MTTFRITATHPAHGETETLASCRSLRAALKRLDADGDWWWESCGFEADMTVEVKEAGTWRPVVWEDCISAVKAGSLTFKEAKGLRGNLG